MVEQYKQVYEATDKYLVGGNPMIQCFEAAFGATSDQFVKTGLPRLAYYKQFDAKARQKELKRELGIHKKVAVYLPTYREHKSKIEKSIHRRLKNYYRTICYSINYILL